jgi:hypothetical protein
MPVVLALVTVNQDKKSSRKFKIGTLFICLLDVTIEM